MFRTNKALSLVNGSCNPPLHFSRLQRSAEQWAYCSSQQPWIRNGRVGRTAKNTAQCFCFRVGTYAHAQATHTVTSGFAKCLAHIGGGINRFVAMVVGQAIGKHHKQLSGRSALLQQYGRSVPDGGAEP